MFTLKLFVIHGAMHLFRTPGWMRLTFTLPKKTLTMGTSKILHEITSDSDGLDHTCSQLAVLSRVFDNCQIYRHHLHVH